MKDCVRIVPVDLDMVNSLREKKYRQQWRKFPKKKIDLVEAF